MPDISDTVSLLLTAFAGMGLAAAAGFRSWLPLLVLACVARSGRVELLDSLVWLTSTPALAGLAFLAILEAAAAQFPHWRDGLTPLSASSPMAPATAVIAGALATSALMIDLDPRFAWAIGVFFGGSVAITIQRSSLSMRRPASRGMSSRPLPKTSPLGETLSALLVSGLSLFAPIAAPMVVVALMAGAIHMQRTDAAARRA